MRRHTPIPSGPIACFIGGVLAAVVGVFCYTTMYQKDGEAVSLLFTVVGVLACGAPMFKALRQRRLERLEAEAAEAEAAELEEAEEGETSEDESSEEEPYEPPRDPESRLRILEDLRTRDLITYAEYTQCRAEIIRQI